MHDKHHPRRGSLQFWPRRRSKKPYARVGSWANKEESKILGFAGYKVGMRHVIFEDNRKYSLSKGENISDAVTIIECPPLRVYAIRFYEKGNNGLRVISEVFADKPDKELLRKIKPSKKGSQPALFDDVKLVVYTQPKLAGVGKKKPEIFEVGLGGKDKVEKFEFAKSVLGKEIKISDVFKNGQFVDVHSVTKGKGYQGTVKIFGVKIRQHKAEKTKRGVGTLGAWTPKKVFWGTAMAKKFGFFKRTEYNKMIYKIGTKPEEVNIASGYPHYGTLKSDYLILKGSIPGPTKRLVILTEPIRQTGNDRDIEIKWLV
jgi:large subunit ribosomal protein L3